MRLLVPVPFATELGRDFAWGQGRPLDKGTNPEQAQYLPYLQGYVAFYGGDYKTALDELLKANQNDPFIECMIGQTYEKLGDRDNTIEFYGKASTAIAHNPAGAYSDCGNRPRSGCRNYGKWKNLGDRYNASRASR